MSGHRSLPLWRQLRWHLIIAFGCLAVLPAGLFAAIAIPRSQEQAQQQVFSQLESVAELKQQQIRGWLHDSQLALAYLVSGATRQQLSAMLAAGTLDVGAQERINGVLQDALDQQRPEAEGGVGFETLFIYNAKGQIVAASEIAFIDRVVTRQPYFAPSLEAPYIQSPYYAVGSATLAMFTTLPLMDAQGRSIGVVAGQLDLASLGGIMLEHSGLGATGETYLVSAENNYMLTPSRFDGYSMTQAYHSEGIDRALRGEDGAGSYAGYRDSAGQVIGVYRWVPELQAALIAEAELSEALRGSLQARNLSLLLAGGSILVAVIYGLYTATRISRPIMRLAEAATRITAGDLAERAHIAQRNEIGVLANAFNSMTGRLQQVQVSLEERICERTAELQAALSEVQARADEQARLLGELDEQRAIIRELSVPVIAVDERTVVMPLIGALDTARLSQLQAQALQALEHTAVRYLILDITGVPVIDSQVAQGLLMVVRATRLLGIEAMLVGIRPEVAQAIVGLGLDLQEMRAFIDLQAALAYSAGRGSVRASLVGARAVAGR
jgi:anti-anti-sigma regulatory factor/HAMP domain-containing protein